MARFDIGSASSRPITFPLQANLQDENIKNKIIENNLTKLHGTQKPSENIKMKMNAEDYLEDPLLSSAMKTVDWEGRRDANGNLAVYKLPSGDMGGSYEIAGINDKYHPEAAARLASLPPEQREIEAAKYIREYTKPFVSKLPEPIQAFAQDMAFNRGMGGATKYMQQGLNSLGANLVVDGSLGPKTLSAINSYNPLQLMRAASLAQLQDEQEKARQNPDRQKFINGLTSRVNSRLAEFGQG